MKTTSTIKLDYMPAKDLQAGMSILNIGVVERLEEYSNAIEVFLSLSRLYDHKKIAFSKHEWVHVVSSKIINK